MYQIYGFSVTSEIDLPEAACSTAGSPQVHIISGRVSIPPDVHQLSKFISVSGQGVYVAIPGVALYHIHGDLKVTVDANPDAPARLVRTFIFGVVFAVVLYRLSKPPLHLSAISTPLGAVAFSGPSGAGKSSTAAFLNKFTSWPIICDDVALADTKGEQAILLCGLNRLKLWGEKIKQLEMSNYAMETDLTRHDKFHVTAPRLFEHSVRPLKHIFFLSNAPSREVEGAEKFRTLMSALYRPELSRLSDSKTLASQIALLCEKTSVSYRRPFLTPIESISQVDALLSAI